MTTPVSTQVTVYWRPGCAFCSRLRTHLAREGVATREVNIWEDPEGAAFVRSVAGGNETVPTVTVGDRPMVNPPPRRLVDVIRELDPDLVGAAPRPASLGRAVVLLRIAVTVLAVAGAMALASGRSGLTWAFIGLAVGGYLVFRVLRRRLLGVRAPLGGGPEPSGRS